VFGICCEPLERVAATACVSSGRVVTVGLARVRMVRMVRAGHMMAKMVWNSRNEMVATC
jgi:hypothetical protein